MADDKMNNASKYSLEILLQFNEEGTDVSARGENVPEGGICDLDLIFLLSKILGQAYHSIKEESGSDKQTLLYILSTLSDEIGPDFEKFIGIRVIKVGVEEFRDLLQNNPGIISTFVDKDKLN